MTAKNLFITLLVLSGVLVAAFAYGFKIGLDKIASEKAEIQSLEAKIDAVDEKLALTIQTQREMEQLGFIDDIAREVLPQSKDQPEVVAQILLIADRAEVDVSSIQFASTDTSVPISEAGDTITQAERLPGITGVLSVPIDIQISGDYDDMLNMLKSLEQNRRKMQTRSVSINPVLSESGNPTTRVLANIQVDVYVRPT